jgi:demethylmenaquinone methyltransferase/2-methoxy-6-polyprenyl-1,4-benzoquinol methylase
VIRSELPSETELMPVPSHPRDQAVQTMFDRIAARYDLLNSVISFRLDRKWRQQAIRILLSGGAELILDLGTGTGDLALSAAASARGRARIVGLDFSFEMLRLAQGKRQAAAHGEKTFFVDGSALALPFRDATFDGIMTAFVLRNVSDLTVFFRQAARVLKPGGTLVSLDMFPPPNGWFSKLYSLYFYCLVPWIGGVLARDHRAYKYLSESVRTFHAPEIVAEMIHGAGFSRVTVRKFLCGAVCMHIAEKPTDG